MQIHLGFDEHFLARWVRQNQRYDEFSRVQQNMVMHSAHVPYPW